MSYLITPSILKQIKGYKLLPRRVNTFGFNGQRRSKKAGSSLEFSDFRKYTLGDDVRKIDWNTFARTKKYYIKQYLDEQEIMVSAYLDYSKSMTIYSDKWKRARQLAGVFSFLTLQHDDRLQFTVLDGHVKNESRLIRGKHYFSNVVKQLEQLTKENSGTQGIADFLKDEALKSKLKSVRIVISDFLEPLPELFKALEILHKRSQQILLVQVLDQKEIKPALNGDYQFIDIETNESKQVSLNKKVVTNYIARFEEHQKMLSQFAQSKNMSFCICEVNQPLEENIFSRIKSTGWIR